jgi:hypothetical protein
MSSDEWMSEEEGKRDTLKLIIAELKLVAQPVGAETKRRLRRDKERSLGQKAG